MVKEYSASSGANSRCCGLVAVVKFVAAEASKIRKDQQERACELQIFQSKEVKVSHSQ